MSCRIEISYATAAEAKAVRDALAPDDTGFVRSRVEECALVAEIDGATPMKVLHTVEDYLACLAVAEKAVEAARA